MPMKLRDGKLYESLPTSQMLLRDGKVLDIEQNLLVAKNGVIFDILDSEDTSYRGSSPRKKSPGDTEAGNAIPTSKGKTRPNLTMDALRQRKTRRSERLMQEITSEVIEKIEQTSEGSLISTNAQYNAKGGYPQQQDVMAVEGNFSWKSKSDVIDGNAAKARFYKKKSEFITSTPVNQGSYLSQSLNADESFMISGRKVNNYETNSHSAVKRESGYTLIQSNSHHRSELETTSGEKRLQGSIKRNHNESFEDNVFRDLSKPIMYSSQISEDVSEIESLQDQTDFSPVMRRSFARKSINYDSNINLNHARWSQYHDWRRQWYLNRWSLDGQQKLNHWFYRLVYTITSITQFIQQTIVTVMMFVTASFASIWSPKRARRTRASVSVFSLKRSFVEVSRKRAKDVCGFFCRPMILTGFIGLFFVLLWLWNSLFYDGASSFNLTEYNIKNSRSILFDDNKGLNPAWLVSPQSQNVLDAFGNTYPAVFYVRNPTQHSRKRKVDIFKTLSSAAYNVIIPVYTAPKTKLTEGWKWTSKTFHSSLKFLWSEIGLSNDIQDLAKDLCAEGYPPSGVIIESDEETDQTLKVKQFEVWTCNCTTVKNPDGSTFSYTHVRCPVSSENTQVDVISCLQALRK